jgi:hypothetical protein
MNRVKEKKAKRHPTTELKNQGQIVVIHRAVEVHKKVN